MEVLTELGYFALCGQRSYAEVARAESWRWLLLKAPKRRYVVRRRCCRTEATAASNVSEEACRRSRRHKKRHAWTSEDIVNTSIY